MAMRRGFLPLCLIMASVSMASFSHLAQGGLAQIQPPPNPSQEEFLTKFLRSYLGGTSLDIDLTTRYVAAFVDLKDDGMQEVIVYVTGRNCCAASVPAVSL
jgi:hypothetical protein